MEYIIQQQSWASLCIVCGTSLKSARLQAPCRYREGCKSEILMDRCSLNHGTFPSFCFKLLQKTTHSSVWLVLIIFFLFDKFSSFSLGGLAVKRQACTEVVCPYKKDETWCKLQHFAFGVSTMIGSGSRDFWRMSTCPGCGFPMPFLFVLTGIALCQPSLKVWNIYTHEEGKGEWLCCGAVGFSESVQMFQWIWQWFLGFVPFTLTCWSTHQFHFL